MCILNILKTEVPLAFICADNIDSILFLAFFFMFSLCYNCLLHEFSIFLLAILNEHSLKKKTENIIKNKSILLKFED